MNLKFLLALIAEKWLQQLVSSHIINNFWTLIRSFRVYRCIVRPTPVFLLVRIDKPFYRTNALPFIPFVLTDLSFISFVPYRSLLDCLFVHIFYTLQAQPCFIFTFHIRPEAHWSTTGELEKTVRYEHWPDCQRRIQNSIKAGNASTALFPEMERIKRGVTFDSTKYWWIKSTTQNIHGEILKTSFSK